MVENIEIREDGKLSSTELRLMKRLSSRPEAMDSLDRGSLVRFLVSLENEKNLYLARKNVKKGSKLYVEKLFDGVITYINEKVSEDDKLDYTGVDIEESVDKKQYTKVDIVYGQEKLTKVEEFFEFNKDVNKYKIHEVIEPGLTFTYIAGSNNLNKMKAWEELLLTWWEEINGKKTYIFLDGPRKWQRCMLLEWDAIKPAQPEDLKKIDEIRLQKEEQIKKFGHTVWLESFVTEVENKYFANLDKNDKEYGRKYLAKTEKVLWKEMSEDAKKSLETVKWLSKDEFMEGFDKYSSSLKKIMEKEFPAIQRALIAGSERLMKNAGEDFDKKTHFTIYIPNQDRRLSVGVSYDPVEWFTTFPIWYGMRGFGSGEWSKETPLWTFKKKKIKLAGSKYGNLGYTSKSVRWARVDISWLEKGLNTTTSGRGVLLHGVTKAREKRLETWEGYTPRSWGCVVAPTEIARNQAAAQQGEEAYYEIMPPIS